MIGELDKHMNKLLAVGVIAAGLCASAQASIQIGTGLDANGTKLGLNATEINYQVSGGAGDNHAVTYDLGYSWVSDTAHGRWISPVSATGGLDQSVSTVKYIRTITGAGILAGQFSSDNPGELIVNGHVVAKSLGFDDNTDHYTWGSWTTFNYALGNGLNTIEFDVKNLGGPAGLIVDGTFTAVPEPSTVVAGAFLLLPFGVSAIRSIRCKRE